MTVFHIVGEDKKKECSIWNVQHRSDVSIYKKKDLDKIDLKNKIILQVGAEILSVKDCKKDLIIIDMSWREALKFSKRIPAEIEKRSIEGFKTAYPRTKSSTIRPDAGLRSVECMFVAKLIMNGQTDETLLDGYYFKDEFLKINKGRINKYRKLYSK